MAEGGNQNNRSPVSQEIPYRWLSSETCRSQPHSLPSAKPRSRRRTLPRLSSSQEDPDPLRPAQGVEGLRSGLLRSLLRGSRPDEARTSACSRRFVERDVIGLPVCVVDSYLRILD